MVACMAIETTDNRSPTVLAETQIYIYGGEDLSSSGHQVSTASYTTQQAYKHGYANSDAQSCSGTEFRGLEATP